jgi:His-Xaa-Ser system protein HxsD
MLLAFDSKAYCLEAVQKASYRLIDKLTVQISTTADSINCDIVMNDGSDLDDKHINLFKRELLDYQLRVKIKEETESQRNLILSYVFSKSGLQE